ncbi:efflux RND transporter periplasmic adaptor subunit [Chlorobium sp. KB01]|uniref:efflux RND transporter periplasmic adaptor subunit n=1 Tax=Chlorobium sp. KB01 TaxID=1917528 RepID=UPI000976318F|nr:efflux RND transporter periplasmic adaptor subunit [Chlorobium sp. KB01]
MKNVRSTAGRLMKNKPLSVFLFLLLLLALFVFIQRREPKKVESKLFFDRIPVSVTRISKAALRDSLSMTGTVEAIREADIFSETGGLVRRVSAEPGAQKKIGEGLFQIDDELASARHKQAELNYRQAKKNVERYTTLYREGAVALSALEAVQLQCEGAEAEFVAASRKFSNSRIKAPFSGVVSSRFVEQGELVHEGMKVAHMVDLSSVKIIVFVSERDIIKFTPGVALTVTSDLYPAERFSGRVGSVSDKAGRDHTYRVEVVLKNSEKSGFRSGMFARVLYRGDGMREALLVPRAALLTGIRNPEVFVVRNGKAFLRKIVAGLELQKSVEVVSGLEEGDSVVISGQDELRDGFDVAVITGKKTTPRK